MTSSDSALSRPPLSTPPHPNLFRAPRRQFSMVKLDPSQTHRNGPVDVHQIEKEEHGRAPKRRKIESPTMEGHVQPALGLAQEDAAGNRARSPSPSNLFSIVQELPDTSFFDPERDEDASESKPPPPLPDRPWQKALTVKTTFEESKCGSRVRKSVPVPNTPDKLESPNNAPKLGKCVGKCALAGFFPWIGKHPEDALNETTTKHGFSDRPPTQVEKEQSSARQNLHHPFKNRFGLDTLSAIFSIVLDQRNKHRTMVSSSTFKPPPRVTLTEAKRKSWLTDLANVEISLRRLSKTVPQGIRGHALLDQCLVNSVPIGRAIWFVKCVGANEIRTLKRKGPTGSLAAGHEGKWLKDWTSNVEQFLDATARQCGQPSWRSDMQYVLRLCTRLYLDNLLDRDHYLDWVVKSLAVADVNQTPFRLMVIHIYYRDLIRFRKRGRKLAEVLLDKIGFLRSTNEEVLLPLICRLKDLVCRFAMSRPICFLIPDRWYGMETTLRYCLGSGSQAELQLMNQLQKINERTLGSNRLSQASAISPRQKLIEILDAAKTPFDITLLSDCCQDACHTDKEIISTVIEWSTTRFRHSPSRIYVAVRLLRRWHRLGHPVESQLLEFISGLRRNHSIDFGQFHHLILELSRSKTFSVSRYVQWLTITGALQKGCFVPAMSNDDLGLGKDGALVTQKCSDPSQLLTEISIDHVDDHIRNLRNTTLSRAGFDLGKEAEIIEQCKQFLFLYLPTVVQSPARPLADIKILKPDFATYPWSIRSSIAHWLRSQVAAYFKLSRNTKVVGSSPGLAALDIQEFCMIRGVLEEMGDIAVLADVIAMFLTSSQEDLLATAADAVNYHSDVFSAIGAFDELHQSLCHSYVALRAVRRSMPLLATSLIHLGKQFPSKIVSVRTMQTDFLKGDRVRAVAACSPFSDGVAESLQQAGETFLEDFEAILQSESNMNEETMSRLFGVLSERISKAHDDNEDQGSALALCQLLARLRLHRNAHCDRLVERWLVRLLSESNSSIFTLLASLVGTSCISFDVVMKSMKNALPTKLRARPALRLTLSDLFSFQEFDNLRSCIQYRFGLIRSKYTLERPLEILTLASEIKLALGLDVDLMMILPALVSRIILSGHKLPDDQSEGLSGLIMKGLDRILQSPGKGKDGNSDVTSIAKSVDDISLPFCQARFKLLIEKLRTDASAIERMANDIFAIADNDTSENGKAKFNCFSILQGTNAEIASRVRQTAEEAFFASLPSFLHPKLLITPATISPQEQAGKVQKYLEIAVGASQGASDGSSSSTISQLIEKLSNFLRNLSTITASSVIAASPSAPPASASVPATFTTSTITTQPTQPEGLSTLRQHLPFLLQMICLQRLVSSPTTNLTAFKQSQQDQVKILVHLVSIALHPTLLDFSSSDSSSPSSNTASCLVSFTLDVAATLVDELSDEARMLCARFLKDKMRDPRVQFLFGSVNATGSVMSAEIGAGLQMVKDGKGIMGEWKPRQWEILEGGAEPWVGLGVFGARKA